MPIDAKTTALLHGKHEHAWSPRTPLRRLGLEGTPFALRQGQARDSGILYNIQGPDKVWPRSIEFQINEGCTGDFWMTDGAALTPIGPDGKAGARVTGPEGKASKVVASTRANSKT